MYYKVRTAPLLLGTEYEGQVSTASMSGHPHSARGQVLKSGSVSRRIPHPWINDSINVNHSMDVASEATNDQPLFYSYIHINAHIQGCTVCYVRCLFRTYHLRSLRVLRRVSGSPHLRRFPRHCTNIVGKPLVPATSVNNVAAPVLRGINHRRLILYLCITGLPFAENICSSLIPRVRYANSLWLSC
jgi:hypothetical protein